MYYDFAVYSFCIYWFIYAHPKLPVHLSPTSFPICDHQSVLCVPDSISVS